LKCKSQLEETRGRLKVTKETKPEDIWLEKLYILKKEFTKRYSKGVFNMKK